MSSYKFLKTKLSEVSCLRKCQITDLKGQEFDPIEEIIRLKNLLCIKIQFTNENIGYGLIENSTEKDSTLLEFFISRKHRSNAITIFNEFTKAFRCNYWNVNTTDSFALPLLLENKFSYTLDCYIFSLNDEAPAKIALPDELSITSPTVENIQDIYNIVLQDGFYTGDGLSGITKCIDNNEIYLLRKEDAVIGVGFVSPLSRTKQYADIAMIIDDEYRKAGCATYLVNQLIHICVNNDLIPTALTSIDNIASKRTLEKCGFYVDGYLLLAKIR